MVLSFKLQEPKLRCFKPNRLQLYYQPMFQAQTIIKSCVNLKRNFLSQKLEQNMTYHQPAYEEPLRTLANPTSRATQFRVPSNPSYSV